MNGRCRSYLLAVPAAIVLAGGSLAAMASPLLGRIEGQVFDESHTSVMNAYVELRSDTNATLQSKRTDAAGRFTFTGISVGHFRIRVQPIGRNLLDQEQEVETTGGLSGQTFDVVFLEFILRVDKRFANPVKEKPPEALFAQDVPAAAKQAYESGVKMLDNGNQEGIVQLENALSIFPTYFDALTRLGKEHLVKANYEKAYPYLIRAIDVNRRSYSTFYGLAYSLYKLDKVQDALKASGACIVLSPDSDAAHLLHGTLLRLDNKLREAEAELTKARTLAKQPVAEIHWQLALLYNHQTRNKEAAQELETFLKLAPDSPERKRVETLIAKLKSST